MKKFAFKNILIIGSGPIVIGQACEFDYSGTQAIKTLKNLGFYVVLVNSNPATIMTDPELADATYIEPITPEIIAQILKIEKIDAILPTMGGQTALNVCLAMHEQNLLRGVKILGAEISAIKKGEDRKLFKECMQKIGLDVAQSFYAYTVAEAMEIPKKISFPLIIRASFTLGGGGSGIAYNIMEYENLVSVALRASPISEILVEESLLGWKEYEMEVVRDKNDNCVIICSIENVDPMGVHTGDSITIAPALTLTDKEYQRMRDASFAVLREIGVNSGGSNVQFAVDPKNGRMVVIEMNPRVSRSSALASKATGYPIAKVATLLAIGFTLDEITNDITRTPASFEPSIDYIVTKIPRFTFEKFPEANDTLNTSMKSIGEVMAIGANFFQSVQKAVQSLEIGLAGFDAQMSDISEIRAQISRPNALRFLAIADGFRAGMSVDEVFLLCKIDRFFLHKISQIVAFEREISLQILKNENLMRRAKNLGFSDEKIAQILKTTAPEIDENAVRRARDELGVRVEFQRVDTCAGEFVTETNYFYSGFYAPFGEPLQNPALDPKAPRKILILGSGPNRIGQGIEFDYCCVHASFALRDLGAQSVMQNCNPETVSTDYDTSDELFFEPISFEFVQNVLNFSEISGVIVHFGGQTPLKLSGSLEKISAKIIGTPARVIDIAEDREKFATFAKESGWLQPKNGIAFDKNTALKIAHEIGYPVLVRPSYVLGGRAMKIIENELELENFIHEAIKISGENPILIDKFLDGAVELDVDCVCDGHSVLIGGIMHHIEEAGIHSGDSSSFLPCVGLDPKIIQKIQLQTSEIALKLGVIGLMNVQYAIFRGELFLLEVNPRASRTVPFVSKATGLPLAKIATRVMYFCAFGADPKPLENAMNFYNQFASFAEISEIILENRHCKIYEPSAKNGQKHDHIALKASVFPFQKLQGADMILGPEMKSTGEVMGISRNFGESFSKTQIMIANTLPECGRVFFSLADRDKIFATEIARELVGLGFEILATTGTHKILHENGIFSRQILKIHEGRPNVHDAFANGEIDLVINTSDNKPSKDDAKIIRTQVLSRKIPYLSTITGARAGILALKHGQKFREILPLQKYLT